jgi:hypothetical protein
MTHGLTFALVTTVVLALPDFQEFPDMLAVDTSAILL